MTRVLVNGACGHMGRAVVAAAEKGRFLVVGQVDAAGGEGVCQCPDAFAGDADVIIDFSHHTAIGPLLNYAVRRQIPIVVATTGHTEEELGLIRDASQKVAVFRSANMSLGVAVLVNLAKKAAAAFPNADIEIVEVHHNRKADAPSGTALMLADAILEARPQSRLVCGREGRNCKRQSDEIGMHSLRMGNIVGRHEVLISTDTETITIKHEAHTRALFADGALAAAEFLAGKGPGLYNMKDMV